jgi:hypothetical protein
MEPHKITQAEFESLFSDDITIGTQKAILAQIENRISFIIQKIDPKRKWWAYAGSREEEEGDFFKSVEHTHDYIRIAGDFGIPEVYENGSAWFPAHWLWTDFEQEFEQDKIDFEKAKEERKQKNIEKRKRKAANAKIHAANQERIWKSIKEKLTQEEISYICLR